MDKLNWLHLSDIHYNFDNYDTFRMREKTLEYLKSLNIKFEFIIITGDLKYKGASYTDDTIKFINELREKLGIEKENLFIVPGNHDIKRTPRREKLIKGTLKSEDPSNEVNELDEDTFKDLISAQDEFFCFYKELQGREYKKENLHFIERRNGYNIIHINTCLLSGIDGEDKERNIILGQRKLNMILKDIDKNSINIAIGHHSIECINPIEKKLFLNNLADSCVDLYLSGHEHKPEAHFNNDNISDTFFVVCGSGMSDKYATVGFVTGVIDRSSGMGSVSFHQWEPIEEYWHFVDVGRKSDKGIIPFTIKKIASGKCQSLPKNNSQIYDLMVQNEFTPPQCNNQIDRNDLVGDIENKLLNFSIVIIEGLSGCGKTYVVSNYCKKNTRYKEIIWYEAQKQECLDSFFAKLDIKFKFSSTSNYSRCRELMLLVKQREILIIIDNYERVNQKSFSELINRSARSSGQANIIIISNKFVEYLDNITSIATLEIKGFNHFQVDKFIKMQSLRIGKDIIYDLVKKTEGLPLAIEVFITLIKRYNYSPKDLLKDSMKVYARLEDWFTKILKELNEKANDLINMLSICEEPFNLNVVKKFCKVIDLDNVESTFELLQKSYLIQKYSDYRWQVHSLIANYCLTKLNEEKKRKALLLMANYCNSVAKYFYDQKKEEDSLFWEVKSCKYYQTANNYNDSKRILGNIGTKAKKYGYYEIYVNLYENEAPSITNKAQWFDYDYLHCCIILGKCKKALVYIEHIFNAYEIQSIDLQLSLKRLYAEVLYSLGNIEEALIIIDNALVNIDTKKVYPTIINQLTSTKISLLIISGRLDNARELCEFAIKATNEKHKIHKAVLLTRLGIIYELKHMVNIAVEYLDQARKLFEDEDKRGFCWALSHLGFNQMKMGNYNEGIKNLKKALKKKCEIGECSIDYVILLQKMKDDILFKEIYKRISSEEQRIVKQCDYDCSHIIIQIKEAY